MVKKYRYKYKYKHKFKYRYRYIYEYKYRYRYMARQCSGGRVGGKEQQLSQAVTPGSTHTNRWCCPTEYQSEKNPANFY